MIHCIWILSVLYHISTYFLFFEHYFHYNIYDIILISLHRTAGPSRCLFFDIYNTFVVLMTNKPRIFMVVIWLYRILRQQYGQTLCLLDLHTQRWVQFIDIHTIAIFLSRWKYIQYITGWLFIIVLHFLKSYVWYLSVFNQYIYYCDLFCLRP